jgi:hypothetical protein
MVSKTKAKKDETFYPPSSIKDWQKRAVKKLYERRELVKHPALMAVKGHNPEMGVRGLVISTLIATKWKEEQVQQRLEWLWRLESSGIVEIKPSPHLPDTQPKEYYTIGLMDYSEEEALNLLDRHNAWS